jgi:hypothetical protein
MVEPGASHRRGMAVLWLEGQHPGKIFMAAHLNAIDAT